MTRHRSRLAALLDRDGTIIVDRDYTNNPDDVRLLPGAAAAIRRLASAGYPAIVITNQSGIARGKVSLEQYRLVRQRLDELLRAEGAELLDTFTCPHHPEFTGPCACRKPDVALYERAASTHELDLSRCLFAGDKARDITPGLSFGADTVLVQSTNTKPVDLECAEGSGVAIVASLTDAVEHFLSGAS
ncbi:MAG TPA: HAD family hydrolase [Gemmatimonadaceae bacterium]